MPTINRRAMLLGASGVTLFAAQAAARSGVVAAVVRDQAAGPNGALASGLDLEPGQTVATQPGELVNLLFVDGTSLTLGPSSAVRIDRCSFDTASGKGDLALTLLPGQFQLIGGAIGRTGEILLSTAGGSFAARDAMVTFSVTEHVAIGLLLDGQARKIDLPPRNSAAARTATDDACDSIVIYTVALIIVTALITLGKSLSPGQIAKLKQEVMRKQGTNGATEADVDDALGRLNRVMTSIHVGPVGSSPEVSGAIDREVALPRLAPHMKARLANGAEAPGRQPRPAIIQRISARITNKPYQATFPPRQ